MLEIDFLHYKLLLYPPPSSLHNPLSQRLLGDRQALSVAPALKTNDTPIMANAGALVSTERHKRRQILVVVDPDAARIQLPRDPLGLLQITAPDRGTKTHIGVVGSLEDLLLAAPLLDGEDRAEGLLLDDPRLVRGVVDDGGLEVEALLVAGLGLDGAASGRLPPLLLDLGKEILDLVELHLVLDRREEGALGVLGTAPLEGLDRLDQLGQERVVDLLVHEQPLDVDAHLAAVVESGESDLGDDLVEVNIVADDGGIIAAQLEGHTLEGRSASSHDLLAGGGGSGEGDLADVGVSSEEGAEILLAGKSLEDTRGEDLGAELCELEGGVGGIRRGLPDEGVSGQEGGAKLAGTQKHGEVPGDDADTDTKGGVPHLGDLVVVLLNNLLLQPQRRRPPEVHDGELDLETSSRGGLTLAREDSSELVEVLLDAVGELVDEGSTLLDGNSGPGREGSAGGRNGGIDIGLGGDWDGRKGLQGGGVGGSAGGRGRLQLIVDDVVVRLEMC